MGIRAGVKVALIRPDQTGGRRLEVDREGEVGGDGWMLGEERNAVGFLGIQAGESACG